MPRKKQSRTKTTEEMDEEIDQLLREGDLELPQDGGGSTFDPRRKKRSRPRVDASKDGAAPKVFVSRLTKRFQVTIPAEIRARLQLKPGDRIRFLVTETGDVIMKKILPLDDGYLAAVEQTLTEWNSPEDDNL